MKKYIKKQIDKAKFEPGFLGFFINNNFLIRRELNKQIKKNSDKLTGSLIDFGCGTKPYRGYFKNVSEYIGVDYKLDGWEERQKHVDVFYDGSTIPFPAEQFDSMLCTEVLEHVYNIDVLLAEFNRVLKPNGTILVTTPFMWEEHEMPHDFARYTTPGLKYLYIKNGFEIESHFKTGSNFIVVNQFCINYIKNILPQNKLIKQLLLIPFIIYFNAIGLFFGSILPKDNNAYFNNVFVLRKKQ